MNISSGRTFSSHLFGTVIIPMIICFSCSAQTSHQSVFKPAPGSPIAMGCSPGNIVAGDVNNDRKPDFVVPCSREKTVAIFIGNGSGRFDLSGRSPLLLPFSPNEIVIEDMNGDMHIDLVVASHDIYDVIILHGDGNGNFTPSPDSLISMRKGSQPHTHGLGVGDMNGDRYPDIVTANNSDNDVSVALNNGRGVFRSAPGSPFQVSPSPYPLTITDVNNDTYPDIASTSTQSSSKVITLLLGDGRGNFYRDDVPLRTASPWFVAVGDINNDKISDLVITHSERSELTVLIGGKKGVFTEVSGSPFDLGSSAWHVAIADFNRDYNPDIIAAANNGVRVMFGDGAGRFKPAADSPFPTGRGTWHLAIDDFNTDGKPDVITSNLESNNVSVLLGR